MDYLGAQIILEMDNIYIKAMEIGYANIGGIKYKDLKKQIDEEMGKAMGRFTEVAFMKWAVEAFESNHINEHSLVTQTRNASTYVFNKNKVDKTSKAAYESFSNEIWVIKGTTVKQYLDYLELQESRKAAIQAKKQSNISIGIAIFALLVSSIIGVYSMLTAPKPPYDVKVIEDNSHIKEMEEVKERLYKAEMMLEAYKLENVSNQK